MHHKMACLRGTIYMVVLLMVFVDWSASYPTTNNEALMNQLNGLSDEEVAAMEKSLINYLVEKRYASRLRNSQPEPDDLQHKRNYWRQCAFNAVSCFGK